MRKFALFSVVIGIALAIAASREPLLWDQPSPAFSQQQIARQPEGDVERGRYIVHQVAMCGHCHSPRDRRGRIIRQQALQGGRIPTPSPFPDQQWCFEAPKLAGLPGGWSEDELAEFLQTGRRGDWTPRPPMPPYRLTEEDAQAVVAYLRSLR
jgi:mono/diheme cytochrome c family protein